MKWILYDYLQPRITYTLFIVDSLLAFSGTPSYSDSP